MESSGPFKGQTLHPTFERDIGALPHNDGESSRTEAGKLNGSGDHLGI